MRAVVGRSFSPNSLALCYYLSALRAFGKRAARVAGLGGERGEGDFWAARSRTRDTPYPVESGERAGLMVLSVDG